MSNGGTIQETFEATERELARKQTGNYVDDETTEIMNQLSKSLWQVKNRWRKVLRNGVEVVNDKVPAQQVTFKIRGQPYQKTLRQYAQRYFTLNELMQYMVDEIKKNEAVVKELLKKDEAANVAVK